MNRFEIIKFPSKRNAKKHKITIAFKSFSPCENNIRIIYVTVKKGLQYHLNNY